MRAALLSVAISLVVWVASASAQPTPVGALAIDERRGDQYGWAVDHETTSAARAAASRECGAGCSVVLTFERCGAYAADQRADSTAVGWAETYDSAAGAREVALSECRSRGGSACTVRVWGCNGPVVEEVLGLDEAARRQIQQSLGVEGFDPGSADGLFGPRTRAAIRNWQSARGARATGYLDGPQVEMLRRGGPSPPAASAADANAADGVEVVFWESIVDSPNPADFEAYLRRFPTGVFSELAQNRLAAMGGATGLASGAAGSRRGGIGGRASGTRASGTSAGGDGRPRRGTVFRPEQTCAGQPAGASCWQEVSGQPGCYVWNQHRQPGETATWTGACAGGLAEGMGTLTWVWDDNRQTATGRLQDGKSTGHWTIRDADGLVGEGPYANGERNGHWGLHYPDGNVWEGPYVDGEMNGHWVIRTTEGDVGEGPAVDGRWHGRWVIRRANGTVEERLFRDGERVR